MASIYLIRHGQASFASDNYDELSPLGIEQSGYLGKFFSQRNIHFDRVYSGSLVRQQDTAKHMLKHCASQPNIIVNSAFNEIQAEEIVRHQIPKLVEKQPELLEKFIHIKEYAEQLKPYFDQMLHEWAVQQLDIQGVTPWSQVSSRVQKAFDQITHTIKPQETIAIVTSCGPITALLQHLALIPLAKSFEMAWHIVNTSVSEVQIKQQALLVNFNNATHLELLNKPELITYR